MRYYWEEFRKDIASIKEIYAKNFFGLIYAIAVLYMLMLFRYQFLWPISFLVAVYLVGIEFYLTRDMRLDIKDNLEDFILYLIIFFNSAMVFRFTILRFISRYAWAAMYHFFNHFGKILFSEDSGVIFLLSILFCIILCDTVSKIIIKIKNKQLVKKELIYYLLKTVGLFLFLSICLFFTNANSFSRFKLLKWPALLLLTILSVYFYVLQKKYNFTLRQIVFKEKL